MKATEHRRRTHAALFSAAALYWELYRINPELPGRLLAILQEGRGTEPDAQAAEWAAECMAIAARYLAGARA